ncbi:MAG: AAA family ATPase [Candidatus Solibacter sp.]|nr:AAA family ATPase [Candidatus Solibacter sp.]
MNAFDGRGRLNEAAFDVGARAAIREALNLAQGTEETRRTRSSKCKPGHLLLALLDTHIVKSEERIQALRAALRPPAQARDLETRILAYVGDLDAEWTEFELSRSFFDEHSARALESAASAIRGGRGEILWEARVGQPIGADALLLSVLANRGPDEEEHLKTLIDFPRAIDLFARPLRGHAGPERDVYLPQGELDPDRFTEAAFEAVDDARKRAASMGYDRVQSPHLCLALLTVTEGAAVRLIRLQCDVGASPATISECLVQLLTLGQARQAAEIPLHRDHLGKSLQDALSRAQAQAELHRAPAITQAILLWALLRQDDGGPISRSLAEALPSLNRDRLLQDLEDLARRPEEADDTGPFLLTGLTGRVQDLTYLARTDPPAASVNQDALVDQVLRGLHKKTRNNVLITGESGVGKTQLVLEISRRAGTGEAAFLKRKKIVMVDCGEIGPENSRTQLERLISQVKGRKNLIICLDRCENVLRYAGQRESNNTAILSAALDAGNIQLIGIMEDRHYSELLAGDHRMLEQCSRVEVPAPDVETANKILGAVWKERLERSYPVEIQEDAMEKAARAAEEFIMCERLPEKAIRVLREACEHVSFEVSCRGGTNRQVGEAEVIRALASMTGISADTIAGIGQKNYFEEELSGSVVGQGPAVRSVVNRLKLIRAGAIQPGRPAAVFLFAGPTGTGKTELAKAAARVYSASRKLVRYDMTRFKLEHSMQGIFGVPPGYVGFESGGQIVNDLNADAHSVILFDEAEKAHRSIWQGMLSLFDEGWVVDQRNVKAYGNRAIFILTTNAGKDLLRDCYPSNMTPRELESLKQRVQEALLKYQDPEPPHNNPFSPEFLGRLTDVVVFGALSQDAFTRIADLQIEALIADWRTGRKKTLVVDGAVRAKIAEESFSANLARADGIGARAVLNNINLYVQSAAVELTSERTEDFVKAGGIRVSMRNGKSVAELLPSHPRGDSE